MRRSIDPIAGRDPARGGSLNHAARYVARTNEVGG